MAKRTSALAYKVYVRLEITEDEGGVLGVLQLFGKRSGKETDFVTDPYECLHKFIRADFDLHTVETIANSDGEVVTTIYHLVKDDVEA